MAEASNGYGKAEVAAKPAMSAPYMGSSLSLEAEKNQLMNKLWEVQMGGLDAKAQWWSFCKVHAEGNTDPKNHDVAFLLTFFEAMEAGEIGIEEGCPFQGKGDGKAGGKDSWGKGGMKGFGKDKGKGGKDKGGKDKGGKDKGGKDKGGGGGGGGGDECKIFVGGLPTATTTEEELTAHFSWYGKVSQNNMKYDENGGFRGFTFIVFESAEVAQKVLAEGGTTFKGKWIQCKTATAAGGGGGGKGKDKGGKGDKGCKGGKGGKDKGGGKKGGKDKGGGWGGWGGGGWGGW